jgi:dipeptidyl aminopeptidase/acylaminoacyl peptidase
MVARARSLAEPRWSPDGAWLAYLESFDGRGDVMLAPADGGPTVRLTADPGSQPTASYGGGVLGWLDAETVVFVAPPDGQLHAQSIHGGPTRQLTRLTGRCAAPTATPDGQHLACMVSGKSDQHIALVDPSGEGWPVRASRGGDFVFDPALAPDGTLAWQEWNAPNMAWDGGYIRLRTPVGEILTVDGGDDVAVSQPRFSPDGRTLAYVSDRGGWWNLWAYDLASGATHQLVRDEAEHGGPTWGPGGQRYAWAPDGWRIALIRSSGGYSGVYLLDVQTGELRPLGPQDGSVQALSWSGRGDRIAAIWGRADRPTRLVTLDPESGVVTDLATGAPAGFEAAATGLPEAVSWPTPDRATANGLFYRPAGIDLPPLIVRVHGGPTGHVEAGFDARMSYYLDRGWAVCRSTTEAAPATAGRTIKRCARAGASTTSSIPCPARAGSPSGGWWTARGWPSWAAAPVATPSCSAWRSTRTCSRPASTCTAFQTCSPCPRRRIDSRPTTWTRSSGRCPRRTTATASAPPSPWPTASRRRC